MSLQDIIAANAAKLNALTDEDPPEKPDETPVETPVEDPEETPVETPAEETPAEEPAKEEETKKDDAPVEEEPVEEPETAEKPEKEPAEPSRAVRGVLTQLQETRKRAQVAEAAAAEAQAELAKVKPQVTLYAQALGRAGVDLDSLGKAPDVNDPKVFSALSEVLGADAATALATAISAAAPEALPDTEELSSDNTKAANEKAADEAFQAFKENPIAGEWYFDHADRADNGEDVSDTPYAKLRDVFNALDPVAGETQSARIKRAYDKLTGDVTPEDSKPVETLADKTRKNIKRREDAPDGKAPAPEQPRSEAERIINSGNPLEQVKQAQALRDKDPIAYHKMMSDLNAA